MKVLLLDWATGGHHVGYASYITRYFAEQGDEVVFVGRGENGDLERLRAKGAEIRYATGKARVAGNTLHRFLQMSRNIRNSFALADSLEANIVHHLYLERNEIPLYLQSRRLRTKRSWKLFATLFWPYFIHDANDRVALAKRAYHWVNRWALGRMLKQGIIDGLFVHTDRIKERLLKLYGDDSLRQRIFVVPDPVESMEQVPQDTAREELGLPQGKSLLLFFGGLRWDKGPDILLDALPLLDDDCAVLVAGQAEHFGEREVAACRARLQDAGRLIGKLEFIPDEDVLKYFASADVIVLPYRKAFKGTSGVLQHAAAAGKPVIATDVGEVGPTVREYGLGIVVEPESPSALARGIQEFLERRDELTAEIRPRALQYAEANDWRIMARKVREAYLASLEE